MEQLRGMIGQLRVRLIAGLLLAGMMAWPVAAPVSLADGDKETRLECMNRCETELDDCLYHLDPDPEPEDQNECSMYSECCLEHCGIMQ